MIAQYKTIMENMKIYAYFCSECGGIETIVSKIQRIKQSRMIFEASLEDVGKLSRANL